MKKAAVVISSIFVTSFLFIADTVHAFENPAPGLFTTLGITGDITVAAVATYVIKLLLGIVGILSVLFIIIGGFQYITSGGNDEQAAAGKKTLTNAIIGLIIVILSYVIVVVIINTLSK